MASYFPSFMVQNPWAFWALLALLVPLILHLLSKRRAKLIKFANVALITMPELKNSQQIRLNQFWLLLLRMLLLIVSILLLAKVSLNEALISHEEVYLLSADWLNHSDKNERQQLIVNSSNKPIYLLGQHTALINADEILTWQAPLTQPQAQNNLLALKVFTALLTPETKLKLFVTDRANQYRVNDKNTRLVLANTIDWQVKRTFPEHQKHYNNVMNVVIIYDQDRFADLKYFQQALNLIKQHIAPKLSLSSFLNVELENSVSYQQTMLINPHWLFYLSSKAIDNTVSNAIENGTNVIVDGHVGGKVDGNVTAEKPELNLMPDKRLVVDKDSSDLLSAEAVFYRRAQALAFAEQLKNNLISQTDEVLWQVTQKNGAALPLLTKSSLSFYPQTSGDTVKVESEIYQLHSRFSPAWSNLLVSKQFPLLLQNLLFSSWQNVQRQAQQTLSQKQISQLVVTDKNASLLAAKNLTTPRLKNITTLNVQQPAKRNDYTELLMVLLLLLLIVERIVSEVSRTNKTTEKVADNKTGGASVRSAKAAG